VAAPASEVIRRVLSASVTDDRREDLLLLTEDPSTSPPTLRLRYLAQRGDGSLDTDPNQLLLQFNDWRMSSLAGIGFHAGAARLAHGILVFAEGVRFVVPEQNPFRPTMIQSTLPAGPSPGASFGLHLTDFDGDGQVEVVGGTVAINSVTSLRQIDRAYRNRGN
jgi:hypothetical protein